MGLHEYKKQLFPSPAGIARASAAARRGMGKACLSVLAVLANGSVTPQTDAILALVLEVGAVLLVFCSVFLLVNLYKPFSADKNKGVIKLYWIKRGQSFVKGPKTFRQPLHEVSELQLIKKIDYRMDDGELPYYCYELNLVLLRDCA